MRKSIIALLAIALLAVPAVMADDEVTGEAAIGAQRTNASGSANRAGEFESDADGFVLATWFDLETSGGERIELDAALFSAEDQEGTFRYKSAKDWTIEAGFQRYIRNLPHDPLTNLDATDAHGKVVAATDEGYGHLYGMEISQAEAALVYRPEHARAWEVALRGHRLSREGARQHTSTNHCQNCHVIGQTRVVDETIDTIAFTAAYEKADYGVSYEANLRSFNNDAEGINRYYQLAKHPARIIGGPVPWDLFAYRVQYDDATLPIGQVVENQTLTHTLRGYYRVGAHHFDGALAQSQAEASATGLRAKHISGRARWMTPFGDAGTVALHGRYTKLSSDDIFVDIDDSNRNTQGPHAGISFYQAYPDAPGDYVRQSIYDRKTTAAQADLTWRFGDKKQHRFKGSLVAKIDDRDEFYETTKYTLKARLNGKLNKKARYRLAAEYFTADTPFANMDGAFRVPREAGNPASGNPFSDLQYYEMYQARMGDVTNQPTAGMGLKGYITLARGANSALSFNGSFVDQKNDETNVLDWEKTAWNAGLSAWWAPSSKLYGSATYNVMSDDVWTGVSIPIFDG